MMRYVVTGMSKRDLMEGGVAIGHLNLSYGAYLIENRTVIDTTNSLHQACKWIAQENAHWIGRDVDDLPPALEYKPSDSSLPRG